MGHSGPVTHPSSDHCGFVETRRPSCLSHCQARVFRLDSTPQSLTPNPSAPGSQRSCSLKIPGSLIHQPEPSSEAGAWGRGPPSFPGFLVLFCPHITGTLPAAPAPAPAPTTSSQEAQLCHHSQHPCRGWRAATASQGPGQAEPPCSISFHPGICGLSQSPGGS